MIWSALPCPSSLPDSTRTSSRASPAEPRSSTSWMRSASTGVSDANSNASTTSMGSGMVAVSRSRFAFPGHGVRWGQGGRRVGGRSGLDDDLAEELGLVHAGLAESHQLEQSEERDHPFGAHALRPRHGGEEKRPGVPQELDDLAHALEDGKRIGFDLTWSLSFLLIDEAEHGALQEVDGEILERHILGQRELGHRAPVEEGLLRLALAQPGAELFDARVLAQAVGQLLAEELPFLVEGLGRRVGIDGQQQLGFEIDQRGGHDHEGPRRFQILELHGLEMGEVLLGDGPDGQVGQIDFVGPAEVQEEVQRPHEGLDADRDPLGLGLGREGGAGHGSRLMMERTSAMVCWAKARALAEPWWRMSTISRGLAAKRSRRSRMPARGGSM